MDIKSHLDYSSYDDIVASHMHIVRSTAKKIYLTLPQYVVDEEDLISEGVCALLQAAHQFDFSRKDTFPHYVKLKAKGAMLDYLRKQDILSQQRRKSVKDFYKSLEELEFKLNRKATETEILEYMNISKKEYSKIMQSINASSIVYIDSYDNDILSSIFNTSDNSSNVKEVLKDALLTLSKREQLIFQLYFFEDLNFKEAAEVLNISSARISQIYKKALTKLRVYMMNNMEYCK